MSVEYSLARLAVQAVAGLGVAKVISDVITSTAIQGTAFANFKSKVGIIVIGSMVGEQVTKHIDGRIDQIVDVYQKQKVEVDAKVTEKLKERVIEES